MVEVALACVVYAEEKSFFLSCLRAQTITISFKKPPSLLAETVLSVQRTNDVSIQSSVWWCFLNDARTFFDENPT